MENCATVLWIKNLLYLPAFLIAIGLPHTLAWSISSLTFLMFIDVLTGVIASGIIDGKKEITSRKMVAGVVAKSLILLIPFLFVLVGRGIGVELLKYAGGVTIVLILAEFYSITGNIYSAKNGERLPEVDFISMLLKRMRIIILEILDKNKI